MPTRVRTARVLESGASNRSEFFDRSSLRIAELILRKAPMQAPKAIVTRRITARAAMAASEHFRAAVARGYLQVPSCRGRSDLIN